MFELEYDLMLASFLDGGLGGSSFSAMLFRLTTLAPTVVFACTGGAHLAGDGARRKRIFTLCSILMSLLLFVVNKMWCVDLLLLLLSSFLICLWMKLFDLLVSLEPDCLFLICGELLSFSELFCVDGILGFSSSKILYAMRGYDALSSICCSFLYGFCFLNWLGI